MTDRAKHLAALIDRLEKATGPDRRLANQVLLACGWVYNDNYRCWYPTAEHAKHNAKPRYLDVTQPNPIVSIDDALMLVPKGWEWLTSNRACSPRAGRAYMHNREQINVGCGMTPNPKYRGFETTAITPAIALCIAVLKARAGGMEDE